MTEKIIPCPECGSKDTVGIIQGFKLTVGTPDDSNHILQVYCSDCKKQTTIKSDSLRTNDK